MPYNELSPEGQAFLLNLHEQTQGKSDVQVSMFDIGAAVGLEKSDASHVAEELIGWELVEIRTLSGGIGITGTGIREIESLGLAPGGSDTALLSLGNQKVVTGEVLSAVADLVSRIKNQIGSLGLGYDELMELMADVKCLDAQLESPRPKTAVFRACFTSIRENLAGFDAGALGSQIDRMLGE